MGVRSAVPWNNGAYTYNDDESDSTPNNGVVDNKDANDLVAVCRYYYDANWIDMGTSAEAAVKRLGTAGANILGLYDKSGTVWEWCFTESVSDRITEGGSRNLSANRLQIGDRSDNDPSGESQNLGFRLCRTAD